MESRPQLDSQICSNFLKDKYGVQVISLLALPSYEDQNFRVVDDKDNKFVFKISNRSEDRRKLEFHSSIMQQLASHNMTTPQVIPTLDGQEITELEGCAVRLLTYISGKVMMNVENVPLEAMRSLGAYLAKFHLLLADLPHPKMENEDGIWNMKNAGLVKAFTPLLRKRKSKDHQRHIEQIIEEFEREVLPTLESQATRCIIHGDANEANIIVSDDCTQVLSLIDFGDVSYGFKVCDVAIAMAYMMLNKKEPLKYSAAVLQGYCEANPLTDLELDMLPMLMKVRLAVSATMANCASLVHPEDKYVTLSEKPAWDILEQFKETSNRVLLQHLKQFAALQ